MEILNNIWTALSTENEFVLKLISIPGTFVEIYLSFCFFTVILKTNYSKKKKYIYIFSISLLSILISFFVPEPYNVFINYGFIFVFLIKYFQYNILQSISAIIAPLLLFGLLNSLLLNPFLKIIDQTYESGFNTPIYRVSYLIGLYLIMFLVIFMLRHIKLKLNFNLKLNRKTLLVILTNFILGVLTFVIQAFLNLFYINSIPILFTLFNFVLLFAYFFISFYSLTKAMKLDIATRDLENAESYNNSLTILYDNVRGFKHDFDNMVNIIGGYIQVNDIDGLKKYYSSLEKDCSKVRNVQMLNPNIINNPGIYNLIVSKYKKATDLDITINFEFFFDFDNLHMPIYEFSRILGILLDNAIEATKECKEKQINLIFRESRKQRVQIVIIENTYLNKEIDTKKIFEKGFSGKENHTGIGLWEVNQIIKKNNNIVLKTTKDEKYFKQELQIYF